ncbi:hypothetical protein [Epilithonimonas sp.]|uniref:hypothetical protein n=1 Tax=Epilithonimonas sp. TaxID=2894511 RepID=UPI00289A1E1E|nr:hypothetical protein [Epilithonimonas sp.]
MDTPRSFKELQLDEDMLIGRSEKEIEELLGRIPDHITPEENIYILKRYFFGLFERKLHLFYYKGTVTDYYIGIL